MINNNDRWDFIRCISIMCVFQYQYIQQILYIIRKLHISPHQPCTAAPEDCVASPRAPSFISPGSSSSSSCHHLECSDVVNLCRTGQEATTRRVICCACDTYLYRRLAKVWTYAIRPSLNHATVLLM